MNGAKLLPMKKPHSQQDTICFLNHITGDYLLTCVPYNRGCMQNEEYREFIIYTIRQLHEARHILFCNSMNIVFKTELKEVGDVLETGERLELPLDILDTMNDPVVKQIGEVVMEVNAAIEILALINALPREAVEPELSDDDEGKELIIPCPFEYRLKMLEYILDYLDEKSRLLYYVCFELSVLGGSISRHEDSYKLDLDKLYKSTNDPSVRLIYKIGSLVDTTIEHLEKEIKKLQKQKSKAKRGKC
jgi:hypothetical protein